MSLASQFKLLETILFVILIIVSSRYVFLKASADKLANYCAHIGGLFGMLSGGVKVFVTIFGALSPPSKHSLEILIIFGLGVFVGILVCLEIQKKLLGFWEIY